MAWEGIHAPSVTAKWRHGMAGMGRNNVDKNAAAETLQIGGVGGVGMSKKALDFLVLAL
ncbi:hypothetical protein HMPREF6485_0551 [Segatella buccae ATCC 33574]|uniref:Uncharacterized protein n=1 Tax=Segatella buccae ATCC 33574 TaxID=873513 RepID=E6K4V1_9BACT|nr:hypothetical protein HMPREF6485_0551 [Segatella buccae ATCC 33574]